MNKQRKIMLASFGVVTVLITSVFLLRQPEQNNTAPTTTEPVASQHQLPSKDDSKVITKQNEIPNDSANHSQSSQVPLKQSETHQKISGIIDTVSDSITNRIPSLWAGITNAWNWLLAFDTKHLVIFSVVVIFILGSLGGSRSKKDSKQ
ncbi:hypothetical protein ACFQ5D_20570 [Paenibacillus farraposensis]|uniref:Uncharacterized protein n=1 Tax=Paenibacillus farraposensis TaxID=2807095 RepID=A0ABW4DGA3_9BACL|nr:hypothetical protein [Paenibacillus farraposensis]MCC3379299.1 hypothetical protein [Paenibacillus farraposensis]